MFEKIVETNLVPDFVLRTAISKFCKIRLDEQNKKFLEFAENTEKRNFIESLAKSPIALVPEKANEQHYEVPSHFYELCLGKRRKYSSCFYKDENDSLDLAEEQMLNLYIERGQFCDGQNVLELGCGWGSLTLFFR